MTTQSQSHGFMFENEIRTKVFNLDEEANNTCVHDIPCNQNTLNSNENISIKSTKSTTIECGDILRFFKYAFTEKNTIMVVHYKQAGIMKTIKNVYEIDYNKELHSFLFGTITEQDIQDYVTKIKSIPAGKCTKEFRKEYLDLKTEIEKKFNMNISIRPKVDSKNQRRVQCAITKFDEKIKDYITYSNTEPILRNVEITKSFKSEKRQRNKKSK